MNFAITCLMKLSPDKREKLKIDKRNLGENCYCKNITDKEINFILLIRRNIHDWNISRFDRQD